MVFIQTIYIDLNIQHIIALILIIPAIDFSTEQFKHKIQLEAN